MEEDREPVAVISIATGSAGLPATLVSSGGSWMFRGVSSRLSVTPPGFYGTQPGRHIDVTVPLGTQT